MFEKEAEESFMCKKVLYKWETDKRSYIDGFKDGYNKANEWHYVKDGDIPENGRWVCNQDGCYCYYDIDTEQWLDTEGTRTRTIEWCDMPTKEIE